MYSRTTYVLHIFIKSNGFAYVIFDVTRGFYLCLQQNKIKDYLVIRIRRTSVELFLVRYFFDKKSRNIIRHFFIGRNQISGFNLGTLRKSFTQKTYFICE